MFIHLLPMHHSWCNIVSRLGELDYDSPTFGNALTVDLYSTLQTMHYRLIILTIIFRSGKGNIVSKI